MSVWTGSDAYLVLGVEREDTRETGEERFLGVLDEEHQQLYVDQINDDDMPSSPAS